MDCVIEEDIAKVMREGAGALDTAPSALGFKAAVNGITRMKPAINVGERINDVKKSVADLRNKNGLRSAVRQRFFFMCHCLDASQWRLC